MALRRVRAIWTGVAGSPAYLNAWFDGTLGNEQGDVDALEDFLNEVANYQPAEVAWAIENTVVYIDPVTGQPTDVVAVTPRNGGGGAVGDMLPPATQLLLRLPTGFFQAGRQVVGHWNLPYLVESTNDAAGGVAGSVAADIEAAALLLATPGSDRLAVWSRTGGAVFPVDTPQVSPRWAVLRSRRD